jgi:hypothetical protein
MALMSWTQFVKRLIALDVVWGVRAKKAHGINDRANHLTDNMATYNAGANSITLDNQTTLPSWIKPGKYVRIYNGTHKQTPDSQSPTYVVDVILDGNDTTDGIKLLISSINGNIITFDVTTPVITNGPVIGDFTIDGRIAIVTNDESITRINAFGATVFNTQAQSSTGDDDCSSVSQVFADHFHSPPNEQQSPFKKIFDIGDWFSTDSGDTYSIDITHNFDSENIQVSTWEGADEVHLHQVRKIDTNNLRIKVAQRGKDCRFAGCIVIHS